MPSYRVSIVVALRDAASRGLKGVGSGLKKLGATAKNAAKELAKMALAIGAAGFAVKKLAERATKFTGVQRAFTKQTHGNTGAIVQLRAAARGLITDYELMAGFNRAVTLGSAETTTQFAQLTKTAIALGRALGVDATFALESLNLGIGRQSKLVLDNLGIIVKIEEANLKYATSIGKTVEQLTEAEKKEAFRTEAFRAANEAIAKMGGPAETAADSVARLFVQIGNLKDELLALAAESPAIHGFFATLGDLVNRIGGGLGTEGESAVAAVVGYYQDLAEAMDDLQGKEAILQAINDATIEQFRLREEYEGLSERVGQGDSWIDPLTSWIDRQFRTEFNWLAEKIGVEKRLEGPQTGVSAGEPEWRLMGLGDAQRRGFRILDLEAQGKAVIEGLIGLLGATNRQVDSAAALAAAAASEAAILSARVSGMPVSGARIPQLGGITPTGARSRFLAGQQGLARGGLTAPELTTEGPGSRVVDKYLGIWRQREEDQLQDLADAAQDRAQQLEGAGRMVASSLGAMAEAAIRGSDITADAVIGMVSRIVANLPGVGGLAGSIIGAAGGIFGAIVGGGSRRQRIVPVSVERVSSQASSAFGQQDVTIQIVSPTTGAVLEELEYQLGRRVRRDAVSRIPKVAGSDWTRSGG